MQGFHCGYDFTKVISSILLQLYGLMHSPVINLFLYSFITEVCLDYFDFPCLYDCLIDSTWEVFLLDFFSGGAVRSNL